MGRQRMPEFSFTIFRKLPQPHARENKISTNNKVFARLLGKAAPSRTRSSCRAPQSAKSLPRRFLFDSFFFCACICKRKSGMAQIFFVLAVDYTWFLSCRGRRLRRPAKRHKVTFSFSYFCVTKSTKSQQRELSPLFANLPRVHESVAQAVRG